MAGNQNAIMAFAAADSSRSTTANGDASCHSPARSNIIRGPRNSLGMMSPFTQPSKVRAPSGRSYLVWPMSKDVRDCNDIVHGDIRIPPAVQVVLDSPYVQRLANLKQLGCAFNTYPCCTHTRKEHSLGVMGLSMRQVTHFQQNQPELNIKDKDILCVGMAGLCHDLGHGPFSHGFESFLKAAYNNEKDNPEQYIERNDKFLEQFGFEIPPLPERYEHENTSLMMVDAVLACRGLEIDWDNLDEPLKQVGDGVDRLKFGVVKRQGEVEPFTSRDWIFVKECIYGGPLDEPDAPEAQKDFVGRGRELEFLYDIVHNRHSGLDHDKTDYFLRDAMAAFGINNQGTANIFVRDAVVARGKCPNHRTCFQCKDKKIPGEHLMICYPRKHVSSAMNFFATRINNHDAIYTHKKTKAAELHMVDLLLEADKHFCMLLPTQNQDPYGIPVPSQFENFEYTRLPISRVWMYPRLFLRTDDTIVSIIESKMLENATLQLHRLRQYLSERRNHRFYKCVGEKEMKTTLKDKDIWELSEDQIKEQLLNHLLAGKAAYPCDEGSMDCLEGQERAALRLESEDFIVEKRTLHYGRKDKNPVSQMRFISKDDQAKLLNPIETLPLATEVEELPMNTPKNFLRKTIRIFCRTYEKCDLLRHTFESWELNMEGNPNSAYEYKHFFLEENVEDDNTEPDSQPNLLTQEIDTNDMCPTLPTKRKEPDDRSPMPVDRASAKKRLDL